MNANRRQAQLHIAPEFAPFFRRWQGWRHVLWWLWPIRWAVVTEDGGTTTWDYYISANDAAIALARRVLADREQERDGHAFDEDL